MKKLLVVAGAILLTASMSWAQDVRSEFFFQADAGQSLIQGNVDSASIKMKMMGTEGKLDDLNISAHYENGISEMLSVYGKIGYGTGEMASTDFKGLNPIQVGAKFRLLMGSGEVYIRPNVSLGILSKTDCDTSCNRTDGSIGLDLTLGYLWTFDSAFAGIAFNYGLFSTDGKAKDSSVTSEKEGFMTISLFYEALMSDMIFGGAVSYAMGGISGITHLGSFEAKSTDGPDFLGLQVYTRVPMAEGFSLLGAVNYDMALSPDAPLDSIKGFGFNLGLRVNL